MRQAEFVEYYRTLSPSYEEDLTFISMVKGVWGVKQEQVDASKKGWAGGKDDAQNSRDRYVKANAKGTPFGTSSSDTNSQWATTTRQNFNKPS